MFTLFLVIVYYIVVRLRESYLEFAAAEYYCDQCRWMAERKRNGQLPADYEWWGRERITMELSQAKALLTELADGVDPLTGECLPADSVCNRPEIIRALHCVLRYVSDRPKRSAPLPNAGKPWTEADEAALMQMFDVGCSMEEMQARFQRTNGAIVRRLERLGRLRPGETMK